MSALKELAARLGLPLQPWQEEVAARMFRAPATTTEIRDTLTRTRVNAAVVTRELDELLADLDRVTVLAGERPVYPARLGEPNGTTTAAAHA